MPLQTPPKWEFQRWNQSLFQLFPEIRRLLCGRNRESFLMAVPKSSLPDEWMAMGDTYGGHFGASDLPADQDVGTKSP